MRIVKSKYRLDLRGTAQIQGDDLIHDTRHFIDVQNYYKNPEAAKALGDADSYSVCYAIGNRTITDMYYGITTIKPQLVDGEYNMTKGHFHDDPKYMEYYLCTNGSGYLLKWDGKDEYYAEEMNPGSLHYIDGKYAHRVINIGNDDLVFLAVDSATGGATYGPIEKHGFPVRCFKKNGEPIWEKQ